MAYAYSTQPVKDLGRLVIARDCFNNWISGRIADVALVLRPKFDVLRLDFPWRWLRNKYRFVESKSSLKASRRVLAMLEAERERTKNIQMGQR